MMERYSFKTMKIYNLVKSTGYTMIKILDTTFITDKEYFKNKVTHNLFFTKIKYDCIIEVFKKNFSFL